MSFPRFPEKVDSPALLTAVAQVAERRRRGVIPDIPPPHTLFFSYSADLLTHAARKQRGARCAGFFGELFLFRRQGRQVGMAGNFGLGAPVTAVLLSEFAAWGVRRFIIVGQAGGLQPALPTGSVVLAAEAIRDEGTSYHYLPPAPAVRADEQLTAACGTALQAAFPTMSSGVTWTTDAPYRETEGEVARLQAEGVLTVEMEAAALFAVGEALGVATAACLVVGDSLAHGRWQPAAAHAVRRRLRAVWQALLPAAAEAGA